MSTNSLVAYLREDGSVVSSYVHYDGHTTGVGEMLLENYNTDKCARDLASCLGYASSLRETVAASHEDRANTDEAEVFEDYHEFEEYIRECSQLENQALRLMRHPKRSKLIRHHWSEIN